MMFEFLRASVRAILERPDGFDWTVQGFGMLRTYFGEDKRFRLNVWHRALAVPGVSIIHDHPWDFTSVCIAGRFTNVRYCKPRKATGERFLWQKIKTGEGGGPVGAPAEVQLHPYSEEIILPGETYTQDADEIHASYYEDGTVTLNDRTRRPDPDHANVFWPYGEQWVTAEPYPAEREVETVTAYALQRWFQ